jgi:tyrosinase
MDRWWDEERDASRFVNSTVFDATYGFGGRSPGCLTDGPFANYSLTIGPGHNNTQHCLSRDIDDVSSQAASTFFLEFCGNATTYEEAWDRIEFYPHSAGHSGVGGEVCRGEITSPEALIQRTNTP